MTANKSEILREILPSKKIVGSWERNTPDGMKNTAWNLAIDYCYDAIMKDNRLDVVKLRELNFKEVSEVVSQTIPKAYQETIEEISNRICNQFGTPEVPTEMAIQKVYDDWAYMDEDDWIRFYGNVSFASAILSLLKGKK